VRQQFDALGFEIVANTPEQFAAFEKSEYERWKKVIQTGNITAN
jgi:tripartite-type tricarboxylate transporter receptor subunit TctC